MYTMSLRSSERGLKSAIFRYLQAVQLVAPFVGAWIEIIPPPKFIAYRAVAPFVGAWIEMHCFALALTCF